MFSGILFEDWEVCEKDRALRSRSFFIFSRSLSSLVDPVSADVVVSSLLDFDALPECGA